MPRLPLLLALLLAFAPAALAQSYGHDKTLVDVASETEALSTLVAAVQAADLAGALSGDGPFTVFAPTNDAFAALPDGTVDALLMASNRDQLTSVLTYHVVAGEVRAADLSDGQVVETLNGESLTIRITDGTVTVNGVEVVMADVEASNGVAHVISGVLLPPAPGAAQGY